VLYEHDAVLVATRYSIMLICASIGALLTGWYCAATRKARWVTVLAFIIIFIAFFAAMASTNRTTNTLVWGFPILMGLALGMTLTTLVTVAQLSTPPELISTASGLIISVRSLGGTVGIAIYSAIYAEQMNHSAANIAKVAFKNGLPDESVKYSVGALLSQNQTALMEIPGVKPSIIVAGGNALLDTYALAFRHVWIAAACFVVVAAVVAAFINDPSKEFTMHVDAPVEKKEDLYRD
jgi:hypothetical protein